MVGTIHPMCPTHLLFHQVQRAASPVSPEPLFLTETERKKEVIGLSTPPPISAVNLILFLLPPF